MTLQFALRCVPTTLRAHTASTLLSMRHGLQVIADSLRDREAWACGWLQREDLAAIEENQLHAQCRACKGTGRLP